MKPFDIDLRSDSITRPTSAMWDAMRAAELGWASAGEDPLVRELETRGANLASKESCLFVLTGNTANIVALMSHGAPGDQVLVEASSHILWCEEWGLTSVAGLMPKTVQGSRGKLRGELITGALDESVYRHRPKTSLLCLENTDNIFGAAVAPPDIAEAADAAHSRGVAVHLDGARIFNASVALSATVAELLAPVDSALIGLNKGLSVPGGALLVGSAEFVAECRLNLRRVGGGSYHQGGILAAAALLGLETMVDRLDDDHRRAKTLAGLLADVEGMTVDPAEVETNIIVVELSPCLGNAEEFVAELAAGGIGSYVSGAESIRFVTHRHIGDEDVAHAATVILETAKRIRG